MKVKLKRTCDICTILNIFETIASDTLHSRNHKKMREKSNTNIIEVTSNEA